MSFADIIFNSIWSISVCVVSYFIWRYRKSGAVYHPPCLSYTPPPAPPFCVFGYLDRIQHAYLQMLEEPKDVDWTITLWLGLDGLKVNPDGTSEWITRKTGFPNSFSQTIWESSPVLGMQYLYANNQITQCCVDRGGLSGADAVMSLQSQLDKLRIENQVMMLQRSLMQQRSADSLPKIKIVPGSAVNTPRDAEPD